MNFYNKIVEQRSDKLAISFLKLNLQTQEYTYNNLKETADAYANKLSKLGVCKGYKVALAFPNSVNWFCLYMALAKIEAVSTLIDFTLPEKEITELIENTAVNLIVTTKDVEKKINANVLCVDAFNNFTKLNNKPLITDIDNELVEKNISTLLFSSGTTSIPSAIMQTTEHLYNTTISCLKSNKINNDQQRFLGLLPNNHIYGLLMNVYAPLVSGSNVRILERLNAEMLSSSFENYKPTVLASVPKIAELLKTKIKTQAAQQGKEKLLNMFLPICYTIRTKLGINLGKKLFHSVHDGLGGCIDIFPTAGAPIAPDTAKFFIGLGFRFMSTYGATETNIPTFGARGEDLVINSVGKAYPGIEIKFSVDGEILIKSPHCMLGYYKNEKANSEIFTEDGYIKSGDIGFMDQKGNLKITGRVKENIVLSNGKKIFPENLEKEFSILKEKCEEFTICGRTVPEQSYSEIHMFIVGNNEEECRKTIKEVNQNLPAYMHINNIHFVGAIPKTNLDKIKRYELLQMIKTTKTENTENMTFEEKIIYDCLRIANLDSEYNYKELPRDTKIFADLGIDSLTTITFLLELEKKYKLDLSAATSLPREITVQEFIDYVKTCPSTK